MAQTRSDALLSYLCRLAEPRRPDDATDATLLRRFVADRREDAFSALLRRHARLVWGVCWRLTRHEQEAEDAFQATFLVLARNAATVRLGESLASWLYGVAYRVATRAARRAAQRRVMELRAGRERRPEGEPPQAWRELQAILDDEVARLPEDYRAAFVLCCLEQQSKREAARALGCPEGTVSSRLTRARRLLRQRLARRGIALSALLTGLAVGRSAAAPPPGLVPSTLRAALSPAAGPGATTAVESLAAGVVPAGAFGWVSASAVLLGLLLPLALGLALSRTPAAPPLAPAVLGREEPRPAAEKPEAIKDLHGDPLPPGALVRLGSERLRNGGVVRGVAFSPDRKTLASAGEDNTVRVWDVATGKLLLRLNAQSGLGSSHSWVECVAFSPDGKLLAAGTGNGPTSLIVWDAATGKERFRLDEKQRKISAVAFSPDGKGIASCDAQGSVILWDADTGKEVRQFKGDPEWLESLAFSPDGKALAAGGRDKIVRVWDPTTGRELRKLTHADNVTSLAYSPDSKTLAAGAWNGSIVLWDSEGKEKRQWKEHFSCVSCLGFLGDGKTLASGSWDRTVRLWDAASGKEKAKLEGHQGPVPALAVSPDDKTLATGSWDCTVRLWDVGKGKGKEVLPQAGHEKGLWSVAFSPDGKTLATAGDDGAARLWDSATGKLLRRLDRHQGIADLLAFSADGKTLTCGDWGRVLHRWDVATGKSLGETRFEGFQFQLSPDGKLLAEMNEGALRVWDLATSKEEKYLFRTERQAVLRIAFSPDSRLLAAPGPDRDGTVVVWDLTTGKERHRLKGGLDVAVAVAFSPDGRHLASAPVSMKAFTPDAPVELWDLATGKAAARIKGHQGGANCLTFSPDGRTLATTGADRAVCLWEVSTGLLRSRFEGIAGGVQAMTFSPDGRRLASAGKDTTALVWDVTGLPSGRQAKPGRVGEKDLEARWTALGNADAGPAHDAVWWLAAAGDPAAAYLRERLRPVAVADADKLAQLVADLESKTFATRKAAEEELERLAELATPALRRALEKAETLESRRRLERLLEGMASVTGERLRAVRAVEALEHNGGAEARRVLEKLAAGSSESRLTREAAAALRRLGSR